MNSSRFVVEDRGHETPCWIWRTQTASRYGNLWVDGRHVTAHRWHYEQRFGPVPDGLELDHLCRQTFCVNPDHLEAVTHAENVRRGRTATVTPEQVRQMRAEDKAHLCERKAQGFGRRRRGWLVELSEKYDVGWSALRQILDGRHWRDVA